MAIHKVEKRKLLSAHALNYLAYRAGKVPYSTIQAEVEELEVQGVKFDEIVEARAKAMRPQKTRV